MTWGWKNKTLNAEFHVVWQCNLVSIWWRSDAAICHSRSKFSS